MHLTPYLSTCLDRIRISSESSTAAGDARDASEYISGSNRNQASLRSFLTDGGEVLREALCSEALCAEGRARRSPGSRGGRWGGIAFGVLKTGV